MKYVFYILLGLLPGLIWLFYYLGKDRKHPEPKRMILKTFVWGMLAAPVAVVLELALSWLLGLPDFSNFLKLLLSIFLISALVEECLKYSVVRFFIIKSSEFDEPIDAMIYCIVAALGFATVENIMVVLTVSASQVYNLYSVMALRFIGATFLHALSSGLVGYYLGLVIFDRTKSKKLIIKGLILAIVFHGLYNYFVLTPGPFSLLYLIILIGTMAFLVSLGFRNLKRLAQS
ncbi:MAG TPA: PrsW family intramembrane metalloprotease [Candidatus Portnoybacteria bacterium]|nr:PrsW family intramembrane metalloprotease [Candidatus Portnoybacteria bacterium]